MSRSARIRYHGSNLGRKDSVTCLIARGRPNNPAQLGRMLVSVTLGNPSFPHGSRDASRGPMRPSRAVAYYTPFFTRLVGIAAALLTVSPYASHMRSKSPQCHAIPVHGGNVIDLLLLFLQLPQAWRDISSPDLPNSAPSDPKNGQGWKHFRQTANSMYGVGVDFPHTTLAEVGRCPEELLAEGFLRESTGYQSKQPSS